MDFDRKASLTCTTCGTKSDVLYGYESYEESIKEEMCRECNSVFWSTVIPAYIPRGQYTLYKLRKVKKCN